MRLSELILKRPTTRFSSAIPLLLQVYMERHNWNDDDYIGEVYKRKQDYITSKVLVRNIKSGKLKGRCVYSYVLDEYGAPFSDPETGELVQELDLEQSDVDIIELTKCVVAELKDLSAIPIELLIAAGVEPPPVGSKNEACIENTEDCVSDPMYPVYKGIDFDSLTKEKFDEIKKHYGMLQKEVEKLTKAIQIATEIGLLFYEKGLEKPATYNVFKEIYRKQFAGIPARLVEDIYNALPHGYKSYVKDVNDKDVIDDNLIDVVIEASVAAGYICKKDLIKDVKSLKEVLAGECEIPPNIYLNSIVGACKRIARQ